MFILSLYLQYILAYHSKLKLILSPSNHKLSQNSEIPYLAKIYNKKINRYLHTIKTSFLIEIDHLSNSLNQFKNILEIEGQFFKILYNDICDRIDCDEKGSIHIDLYLTILNKLIDQSKDNILSNNAIKVHNRIEIVATSLSLLCIRAFNQEKNLNKGIKPLKRLIAYIKKLAIEINEKTITEIRDLFVQLRIFFMEKQSVYLTNFFDSFLLSSGDKVNIEKRFDLMIGIISKIVGALNDYLDESKELIRLSNQKLYRYVVVDLVGNLIEASCYRKISFFGNYGII